MQQDKCKRSKILGGLLSVLSGLLYVLSLPAVRNFIWNKLVGKSREKVIDAKAKIVEDKKKKGIFG